MTQGRNHITVINMSVISDTLINERGIDLLLTFKFILIRIHDGLIIDFSHNCS